MALVLAPAALVLLLRLAAGLSFSGHPLLMHPMLEDADYQNRTLEIHQGAVLDRELPRGSVLYPFLINLVPKLASGGPRALAMGQSILEAVTALLLMLLVRGRWGSRAAAVAGILYALDPLGAFFAARYIPVVPATLCFIGCLWLLLKEQQGAAARPAAGTGFLLLFGGLLTLGFLLQPLPFLLLLIVRGYLLLAGHNGEGSARPAGAFRRALLPAAPLLVICGSIIAQHASLEEGGPVLGWGGGVALHNAYNPATGGTPRGLHPPSWSSDGTLQTEVWEYLGHEGTSYDVFRFYTSSGLREIIENPMGTVGVLLTKALGLAGSFPIPDSISPAFIARQNGRLFSYLGVSFAVLLALGVGGILFMRGDLLHRVLVIGLIACAGAALLGQSSAASRQPALPLLAALGAAWITAAGGRKARLRPALVGSAALALVVSVSAGFLAPTSRLRRPSEDLRLVAATFARTQANRQAIPLLEEAVRVDPKNLEARVSLAQAYQKDGLVKAAGEQLEAAYQADSTHAGTLFALALLDQSRGDQARAVSLMSRLVSMRPNNPLYLNELGRMLIVRGQMGEAQLYLQRAIRLKPDYTVAQQNLQVVEMYRQRMEESLLPPSMRLAEADPLQQRFVRITDDLDQSKWQQADSLIELSRQEHPELVQPHWFRAAYYARRGEPAPAINELELCCRMAPGRPLIVQELIRLYGQTGQTGKMLPLLRESMAAASEDTVRVRAFKTMEEQITNPRTPQGHDPLKGIILPRREGS